MYGRQRNVFGFDRLTLAALDRTDRFPGGKARQLSFRFASPGAVVSVQTRIAGTRPKLYFESELCFI